MSALVVYTRRRAPTTVEKMNDYKKIRQLAQQARACPYPHFCQRYEHQMTAHYNGGVPMDECEVWDPGVHGADPETHELVFSGSKQECQEFIQSNDRYYLEMHHDATCRVCDAYEARQRDMSSGKQPAFFIVAYGVSRHFGGREEGGWWYDNVNVIEVRKAFTLRDGLRHAHELKAEYEQPRYNRFSAANRGEPDIYIRCVYSMNDPRMPQDKVGDERYE